MAIATRKDIVILIAGQCVGIGSIALAVGKYIIARGYRGVVVLVTGEAYVFGNLSFCGSRCFFGLGSVFGIVVRGFESLLIGMTSHAGEV